MAKSKKEKLPKELTRNAWILVVGAIAPMLDSTMVNIAINKLQSDLHTSLDMIQWAITGYVLALAVAVPVCGYVVNHIDGKKVMQYGRTNGPSLVLDFLVFYQELLGILIVLSFSEPFKDFLQVSLLY